MATRRSRTVTITRSATQFAAARGGRVYVWAEDSGLRGRWIRASTSEPGGEHEYERHEMDGIEVLVASTATAPEIKVRRGVFRRGLVAEWPRGSVHTPGGA